MTTNDLTLTECSRTIHRAEQVLDRLIRDSERDELRRQLKNLVYAAFKGLERLDELERV